MNKFIVGLMEPIKRWESHWHPIGIMYISSYLEKYGYRNFLINKKSISSYFPRNPEETEKMVLNKIGEFKLHLLGITCALNEINYLLCFTKKVKKEFPELKIMVGGPAPTTSPEIFLKEGIIDFVVRGEGEKIALNLVKSIEEGNEPENVLGVSYIRNGKIIHNPPQPLIDNLDSIPRPAYEKINMEQYNSMHEWVIRGFPLKGVFVMTSRGCPFGCTFCGASVVHGKKVRYRSPENVYNEIRFLKEKYGVEGIFFCDDTFLLNKKHVLGICDVMKGLNMLWSCFSRVDTIDEELLKIMKRSGCIQMDFGVESGSNRILKIIKKGTTVEQTRKAFKLCKKYKFRTFINIMMGFPTESESEMFETFYLAKELNADAYILSIAMPIPGTKLWNQINPQIKVEEMDRMNWGGEDFETTNKFNHSAVDTRRLIFLYNYFFNILKRRSNLKAIKNYHGYLRLILKMGHKISRLWFVFRYHLRPVKSYLRKSKVIYSIYLFLNSFLSLHKIVKYRKI